MFRRHANCDCTVVYDPSNGSKRVQDVWSKSWNNNSKLDKIQRKIERIQREITITLPDGIEDVTKKYLSEATPGKGRIEIDSGIDVKNNKEDIKIAKWLKDTFGGEIRVVKALNKYKEGTPDYIWNNKQWELKSPSSKNAIDKRMQKAGHQLGASGGGMVIDITNVKNLSIQEITEFIAEKLPKRAKGDIDLIIVKDAKLINVMRYKKK